MLNKYYQVDTCLGCKGSLSREQLESYVTYDVYVGYCKTCDGQEITYELQHNGEALISEVRIQINDQKRAMIKPEEVMLLSYDKFITLKSFIYIDHENFDRQLERAEKLNTYQ